MTPFGGFVDLVGSAAGQALGWVRKDIPARGRSPTTPTTTAAPPIPPRTFFEKLKKGEKKKTQQRGNQGGTVRIAYGGNIFRWRSSFS